jgi:hypothetical protein
VWDLRVRWSRSAVSAVIRKFGLAQNGQKSLLAPIIERRGIAALGSKRATTSATGESKRLTQAIYSCPSTCEAARER